jgi:hypothetical protein
MKKFNFSPYNGEEIEGIPLTSLNSSCNNIITDKMIIELKEKGCENY